MLQPCPRPSPLFSAAGYCSLSVPAWETTLPGRPLLRASASQSMRLMRVRSVAEQAYQGGRCCVARASSHRRLVHSSRCTCCTVGCTDSSVSIAGNSRTGRLQLNDTARAQADDGYLYPLERAFFYVHKPPTLLVHDECEAVEFMRQGGGVLAASAKTFDLAVRMRNDQARSARCALCTCMCRSPALLVHASSKAALCTPVPPVPPPRPSNWPSACATTRRAPGRNKHLTPPLTFPLCSPRACASSSAACTGVLEGQAPGRRRARGLRQDLQPGRPHAQRPGTLRTLCPRTGLAAGASDAPPDAPSVLPARMRWGASSPCARAAAYKSRPPPRPSTWPSACATTRRAHAARCARCARACTDQRP